MICRTCGRVIRHRLNRRRVYYSVTCRNKHAKVLSISETCAR